MTPLDGSVFVATSVITMNPEQPRAEAIGIIDGQIAVVGTRDEVIAAMPTAALTDLGDVVLLPGFIEPHGHTLQMGMAVAPPCIDIRPFTVSTWDAVRERMKQAEEEAPDGQALIFVGLDPLLHDCETPGSAELDEIFGDRIVLVNHISGHASYATSAALATAGITAETPDPVGGSYEHAPDGSLTGRVIEMGAVSPLINALAHRFGSDPLRQTKFGYAMVARSGVTTATELYFEPWQWPLASAIAVDPNCPLRMAVYHVTIDSRATESFESERPQMLWKQGVKLWADGSTLMGNISISFEYIDSTVTKRVGIKPHSHGGMNYSGEQIAELLDRVAPFGWQVAIHVQGDSACDIVLDEVEAALERHSLAGTDHRWRLEHCGAVTDEQFARAAALGLEVSLFPAMFYWWGKVMVGGLFSKKDGRQWSRTRSAFDAGLAPSFHNDGTVTPPAPLLSIQAAMTRQVHGSSHVYGREQRVSLDQALAALTINPARQLFRDHDLGSIEVGKRADLVALSHDPYDVPPDELSTTIDVVGTWIDGRRIEHDAQTWINTQPVDSES